MIWGIIRWIAGLGIQTAIWIFLLDKCLGFAASRAAFNYLGYIGVIVLVATFIGSFYFWIQEWNKLGRGF